MHRLSCNATTVLAAALSLWCNAATAFPQACSDKLMEAAVALTASVPAQAATLSAPHPLGDVADDGVLAETRGGSDLSKIDTTLSGTVSGNSASHVFTGSNVIQSGAFANMSGIPIVVQNTGANVLIQNATVINLQLK